MKKFIKENFLIILFILVVIFILYKKVNFVEINRPYSIDEYVFFVYATTLFGNTISNFIVIAYIFIISNLLRKFFTINSLIRFNNEKLWIKNIMKNIFFKTTIIIFFINICLILIYKINIFHLNKITLLYILLCFISQVIGLIGIATSIFLLSIKTNKIQLSSAIIYILLIAIKYINLAFKSVYLTYYEFTFFISSYEEYLSKLNLHVVSIISLTLITTLILNYIYTYCERKDILLI